MAEQEGTLKMFERLARSSVEGMEEWLAKPVDEQLKSVSVAKVLAGNMSNYRGLHATLVNAKQINLVERRLTVLEGEAPRRKRLQA